MVTIYRNDFTDAAVGTNVQASDPGAPDAWTAVVNTGGTIKRDQTPGTSHLPMYAKFTMTSAGINCLKKTIAASNYKAEIHLEFYYDTDLVGRTRIGGIGTAGNPGMLDISVDSSPMGQLAITNHVGSTTAGTYWTSGANGLQKNTKYRIEASIDNSAGDHSVATVKINTYIVGNNTPIAAFSTTLSSFVSYTSSPVQLSYGCFNAPAAGGSVYYLGDCGGKSGDTTELGEYASAASNTASPNAVTSNPGAWVNVGSASSIPAALADTDVATLAQSDTTTQNPSKLRVRMSPLNTLTSFGLVIDHILTAAGAGTAYVRLYGGSTLFKQWTITPSTTLTTDTLTLSGAEIAAITAANAWGALDVEVEWGV